MAQIIFSMSDEAALQLTTAICYVGGYQATIPDENGEPIDNPQTPAQFTQQQFIAWGRQKMEQHLIATRTIAIRDSVPSEVASIPVTVEVV